jgi:hypothetical protein
VLIEQTPESAYSAVLGGDLIYDRLLEGKTNRKRYRADFNVRPQQTLVGMASTWGLVSLLATFPDLPVWLMRQLPADHRLVMTVHPAAWCEHSPEQVREVLRDAAEKGLDLLEPGDDWQKLVVAADVMISDHTSVTSYAAGVGVPVLLSHIADDEIAPTSLMAQLAKVSPVLDRETPILEQLNAARHARPFQHDIASSRISCTPGKSAEVIRKALYRLLELSEPRKAPRVEPMPFAEVDFWKFA